MAVAQIYYVIFNLYELNYTSITIEIVYLGK